MSSTFASQAPNAQDVVLWRALRDLPPGRCAEVGDGAPLLTALTGHGWAVLDRPEDGLVVLSAHGPDVPPTDARVVVVTDPGRTAPPVLPDHRHVLFDGVSDVLVHRDHLDLAEVLAYPACSRDDYSTPAQRALEADVARWRARALEAWELRSTEVVTGAAELELEEIRATLSWRITAPLRAVSARIPARHRG